MFRMLFSCSIGIPLILQSIRPASAWDWYCDDQVCGRCEISWNCCELPEITSNSCSCETGRPIVEDCGCGSESVEISTTRKTEEPTPAESNGPEAPQIDTAQPTLESGEELPPAPIAVPRDESSEANADELYPGPAAPADATPEESVPAEVVPPSTPATEPRANTEGLFEEPAAEAAPESAAGGEAASTNGQSRETSSFDELFEAPQQSEEDEANAAPRVEAESSETDTESSEMPSQEPKSDPLDELFGPSSSLDRPIAEQQASSPLHATGGLASSEFRSWSNRADGFYCEGRLVRMTVEGVFLAQPSGELVAVAFSQLSDRDLRFIRGQIQAQRSMLAEEAAGTKLASQAVQ